MDHTPLDSTHLLIEGIFVVISVLLTVVSFLSKSLLKDIRDALRRHADKLERHEGAIVENRVMLGEHQRRLEVIEGGKRGA